MTDTTPLSPAAQAVLDAAAETMECSDGFLPYEQDILAAGLRAAADQLRESCAPEAGDWLDWIAGELERSNA